MSLKGANVLFITSYISLQEHDTETNTQTTQSSELYKYNLNIVFLKQYVKVLTMVHNTQYH
jgi:hypothetical protein